MPLNPGVHLGPYEILSSIGHGGMGEVYKARDTRLNRTVAVKVLPPDFATRPDWKQRFEREAQILASLNDPHICTVHDVGQQDGIHYLVMEYLDGQTLAQRLERGPLPLDEALKIAIEITDALGKAHRQGIVHRDLKPANVMLTKSGVKLLDFGLAKPTAASATNKSNVPTAGAAVDVTAEGTILGTIQYMSPEQLEGMDADHRSDIFAFGAVLYEMLAGRKAFEGRSQSSIIAAIMHLDPPAISSVKAMTPALLDRIVKTCLAKDPDKRWQAAPDLGMQLQWIVDGGSSIEAAVETPGRAKRYRFAWIVTGIAALLVALLAVPAVRYFQRPVDSLTSRFELQTPAMPNAYQISISPDGATVAYVAVGADGSGKTSIFVRPIDSVTARPLPGTEGALLPFWSPDSNYIGYADPQNRKIEKVSVRGGPPQDICDVPYSGNAVPSGTWNSSGIIVFSNGDANQPLYRVAAAGGVAAQISTLDKTLDETGHAWPWFLPDGRHFLYMTRSSKPENSAIYVGALDSPQRTKLLAAASMPVFAPPGFLLFHRQGALFAQRFDEKSLTLAGEPVLIAENLLTNPANGRGTFGASATGTLIYRSAPQEFPLTWVDRRGNTLSTAAGPAYYMNPTLSPDGKRVVVTKSEGSEGALWIIDLIRGASTRLTANFSMNVQPVWSPDGKRLAYASDRGGTYNLYVTDAEGTGKEELLFRSDFSKFAQDWSSDGQSLLYASFTPNRTFDLWVLPMVGDRKPFLFLQTHSAQVTAHFSPNGHWIIYSSNESGSYGVYVQSFPTPGERYEISNTGGMPRWSPDGKEIFYLRGSALMAVDVIRADKTFVVGVPRVLFLATTSASSYDVSRDGQRFLIDGMIPSSSGPQAIPITVVLNWPMLLNKK